jgi:hypothetical protein
MLVRETSSQGNRIRGLCWLAFQAPSNSIASLKFPRVYSSIRQPRLGTSDVISYERPVCCRYELVRGSAHIL